MSDQRISVALCVHNEAHQLAACLERLSFADEIVVLLDKCTDDSLHIAMGFTDQIIEGAWEIEGERRNAAIEACSGDWVLEVDADERVGEELAREIRETVENSTDDWHEILVDNYIGERLVRWGWGASFGKAAYPGLFRKGVKSWGPQRVHPSLTWTERATGTVGKGGKGGKGAMLQSRLVHYVDRNVSDMIKRFDGYTTARAKDLRDSGNIGSTISNIRRLYSRFFKCYILRKGYREGGYGLLIALFAGLYPLISHLKAKLEED